MATDTTKLAKELLKSFPDPKPNGTFAPPPSKPLPLSSDYTNIYEICGIGTKPPPSAY